MNDQATYLLRGVLCALVASCAITVSSADETKTTKEKPVPPGILKKYDADKDGSLDEQEKAAWTAAKEKRRAADAARRLKRYDTNKDGTLDDSERAAEKAAKKEAAAKRKRAAEEKEAEKDAAADATTDTDTAADGMEN